ncbi:MAG TPA: ATP-grasp domain-containing protein, partial [Pirellulales bacterium]|nr:ATP-grasp domain-containing protein [Pirellulales bacterium]
TGALENQPDLVDRIAAVRPLYGICGEPLRGVRDPLRLAEAVRAAGFNAPRCSLSPADLPTDGSWLIKPLASAGGHRIKPYLGHAVRAVASQTAHYQRLSAEENRSPTAAPNRYFQEWIDGEPASAVYIAFGNSAICLGVTRQLIGLPWCGAADDGDCNFRYCGSVGPLDLPAPLAHRFENLGKALAAAFRLRGLFGLDVIIRDGEIWPIELNPRYTASTEIVERSRGLSAVRLHVNAFVVQDKLYEDDFAQEGTEETERKSLNSRPPLSRLPPMQFGTPQEANLLPRSLNEVFGKAVLYANEDLTVSETFLAWVAQQNVDCQWPRIADIPAEGSAIRTGQPIVTVFAEGPDESEVLDGLKARAQVTGRKLAPSPA